LGECDSPLQQVVHYNGQDKFKYKISIIKQSRGAVFAPFYIQLDNVYVLSYVVNVRGCKMQETSKYIDFLKFRQDCPYFGMATRGTLNAMYKELRKSKELDNSFEYRDVFVGKITEKDICQTLAKLMSYNPLRWGMENPFLFGLGAFYTRPGNSVGQLAEVNRHIGNFLYANNWSDDIVANNGCVRIGLTQGGHANAAYNTLAALFHAARVIADQNVADFKDKKYQSSIVECLHRIHPNRFGTQEPTESTMVVHPDYIKLLQGIRLAKSNIDAYSESNYHNESVEDRRECAYWEQELNNLKTKHMQMMQGFIPRVPFVNHKSR
jgi:hypothetical protein